MSIDLLVDMENALQAISRTNLPARFKPSHHELRDLLEEAIEEIEYLRGRIGELNDEVSALEEENEGLADDVRYWMVMYDDLYSR